MGIHLFCYYNGDESEGQGQTFHVQRGVQVPKDMASAQRHLLQVNILPIVDCTLFYSENKGIQDRGGIS